MSLEFDVNNVSIESEQEDDPVEDSDTVSSIQDVFKQQFIKTYEECGSLKKKYITNASNSHDFTKIAVGLGNEMQVYDLTPTGLSKYVGKNEFGQFDHAVSGVKFFNNDSNLIMASTIAGEIHMYDLRSFKKVFTFEDDTEVIVKPVSCFDINSNNRLICAGTDELPNHNVYILFFDIRERRLMGGFFESHQEEVTDVKFHPTDPDSLATGSTDGLINIFDVKKESEDDALLYSLNTSDSVDKLKWHHDKLSCITNTNNLHLYEINTQDLLKKWTRSDITKNMKRKSAIDCEIVDCYNYGSEMMCLATSNFNKGECIRSLKFDENKLEPLVNFTGNTQIIRASLYNEKDNVFLTFGERALITVWKEGKSKSESNASHLKEESSVKKKMKSKANPY